MNVFDRYFQRNEVMDCPDFSDDIALMVIVPVFDDPDIFETLESLSASSADEGKVGVIVIVNHSESCEMEVKRRNRALAAGVREWIRNYNDETVLSSGGEGDRKPVADIQFGVLEAFDLPARFAGVGLARKRAMDVASAYFWRVGKTEQAIASTDADTFVALDYFNAIIRFFREQAVAGVSIAYEHRLDEPHCTGVVREAMIRYELYLRYYQFALHYTGHPHAYTCIGSAFAVRASDYVAQGGMNRRQAGEDFYFLQKLIATGRYAGLYTTKVYPSARISARTPFGTGQSVRQIVENGGVFPVYNFEAFRVLRSFFAGIGVLYKADGQVVADFCQQQPVALRCFLTGMDFKAVLEEVNGNCASEKQFMKRFFDHFNAFRVLKYLNQVHSGGTAKVDILEAVNALLSASGREECRDPEKLLLMMRACETL